MEEHSKPASQTELSEQKYDVLRLKSWRSLLLRVLIAASIFGSIFLIRDWTPSWTWKSPFWYSTIGGTAGGLAIFWGVLIHLIRPFRERNEYLDVVAGAFIAAGVSGFFGLFLNDAPISLWLQCQAVFLGSIFLSAIWLPTALIDRNLSGTRAITYAPGIALTLLLWFVFRGRDFFPSAIADSALFATMKTLTAVSGALFLIALPRICKVVPAPERGVLLFVATYLGLGGIAFPFTRLWGSDWWLVQILQNAPYLLTIPYILRRVSSSQKRLLESEARFRGLFDAAPVGIGIIDNRNNTYWRANPALCRLTGLTEEELKSTPPRSIICPDDVHDSFDLRNRLFSGELTDYCTTRKLLLNDGQVAWVKVRGSLISLGESAVQELRIVEDVTAEKIATDKVSALLQELTRANTELARFASVASHDLKSPLRTVSAHIQMISKRLSGNADSETRQFLKFAVEGCARMMELIDDLLSYASISRSAHEFKMVNCNQVLSQVLRNLDLDIKGRNAKVTCAELPTVSGERTQLTQLFQNLIGNALKYNSGTPVIDVGVADENGEWVFSVRDNGIGFKMEDADKIFDEFQRLNSQAEYSGTGLGLSICKSIVSRHGGRIWVRSSPGNGTTFFLAFPKATAHGALKNTSPSMAKEVGVDGEFTGPFPRYSGAISAVIDGSPEDINKMPAARHPATEGPTYDGSCLSLSLEKRLG